jgi:protein-disulfide isomerase
MSIIVAGLIIAGAIYFSNGRAPSNLAGTTTTGNPQAEEAAAANELAKNLDPVTDADHIRGSLDAKVTIVEFSDFDCPFCQKVHETFKQITTEYSGSEVAWVYRHLPLTQLHPNADIKAFASECAAEQGGNDAFWKFADAYIAVQDPAAGKELPIKVAEQIGLNVAEFQTCLDSNKFFDKVDGHMQNAGESGARGTPYSIIISEDQYIAVSGAQPYQNFKNQIDALLAN